MADYSTIAYEVKEHVAWLRLARPDSLNAIDGTMRDELAQAWSVAGKDSDVHVVVVTGEGKRAFCSGADRGAFGEGAAERVGQSVAAGVVPGTFGHESDLEHKVGPKSAGCWKPVIAAVNGIACGGAFFILGESDVIIASERASFFDPHVTFGMVSAGESMRMAARIPLGEILRMQLVGSWERMSAVRALVIGLVSEVVAPEDLLDAAGTLAGNIAKNSPAAVQGTLRAIWTSTEVPPSIAASMSPHFLGLASLDDWKDGQTKFSGGNRPLWRLR